MLKKNIALLLLLSFLSASVPAQTISEQEYVNRLTYHRNRLELVTQKRRVDETRTTSYTDIDTISYSLEAYTYTTTDIATHGLRREEEKVITEWFIYKGGLRELTDAEFLRLVGDQAKLQWVLKQEQQKSQMRGFGNILIGAGLVTMLGGAAFSASSTIITSGGLVMTGGFFLNAFNLSPDHYIQADFAQEKIDEYNLNLKKKLGLPLDFK
jgi:hypothetical protein